MVRAQDRRVSRAPRPDGSRHYGRPHGAWLRVPGRPRFRLASRCARSIAHHEARLFRLLALDAPPIIVAAERQTLARLHARYQVGVDYWRRRGVAPPH